MFHLLQSIWLSALAGISIPVIIHLWSRRPGKTLKVGSIALVTESTLPHKSRIRLTEWLLLLLRCLLLAVVAVALAQPLWRAPATTASKGWILLSRQGLTETYNRFRPAVDSLLQAGLEFHYFEDGFAKDNLSTALQSSTGRNDTTASYRSLISLLNEQVNTQLPVYIFTDNYLRHFRGRRLPVSLNLHWRLYTPGINAAQPRADTSAIRVTVFSHGHANDARYLIAALDAIRQFSKKNITLTIAATGADVPPQQDWLFWLSGDQLPPAANARNVLAYASGEGLHRASVILPGHSPAFAPIALYRFIAEQDTASFVTGTRWKNGFGNPVLSVQRKDNVNHYTLFTHLDPAWTDLPWSEDFPWMLYQLLYEDINATTAVDNTIIDSLQAMPVVLLPKEAKTVTAVFNETRLAGFCWLLAFGLLFAERALSFYHHKKQADG